MAEILIEFIGEILESDEFIGICYGCIVLIISFVQFCVKIAFEVVLLPCYNIFRRLFAFKISTLLLNIFPYSIVNEGHIGLLY